MHCPYCSSPIDEQTEQCPECKMSLEAVKLMKGAAPKHETGFSDATNQLSRNTIRDIQKTITDFQRSFPQVKLHIILSRFVDDLPLPASLFWIMNESELCSTNRRGGKNFEIIIGINPEKEEAAGILGYGIEMVAPERMIESALESAGHALGSGKYADAVSLITASLTQQLSSLSASLSETLGFKRSFVIEPSADNY